MYYAFDPSASIKIPIHVGDWNRKNPGVDAECIFCGSQLSVRGSIGDVTMHFMHRPGSNCPTIPLAAMSYQDLNRFPRDPSIAVAAKKHARDNFFILINRILKVNPKVSWSDIEVMTKEAKVKDIWSLKSMPFTMIPYALLTCITSLQHPKNPNSGVYYVIQPSPGMGDFWNFPTNKKRYILEVDASTKIYRPIEMNSSTMNSFYLDKALANLA